jgi:hypothetical protein
MMISERIQAFIHALEVRGGRWLNYAALALLVLGLGVWYDTHCYHNFNAPEAMDAAQVARNLAEGKGFTTGVIRPFSVYLLQKHNRNLSVDQASGTNGVDTAEVYGPHPDLANAPLYPVVLAGLFKVTSPDWKVELHKPFWSDSGRFVRYKPEFLIAIFNQLLLLAAVLMTFLVAKNIFDAPAAWLAAVLMLFSDTLWKFSVSGLPTLLLLVIFLGVIWTLAAFEALWRVENPEPRRQFVLAICAGLLTGLGMLTRYSFGWVIVPVFIFFVLFGRSRRIVLAMTAFLAFVAVVLPWVVRNLAVSGTFLGTAGYAVAEDTIVFPGSRLMQSLTPDMAFAHLIKPYLVKLQTNLSFLLPNDMLRLGGGWVGVLFLAGLLLGLRNVVGRRLRYFAVLCTGVFLVVTAMGRTQLSDSEGDMNAENLLVLLTPLVVIFGVAFFLTLLNQMNVPTVQVRYGVIGLVTLVMCQQLIITLLPPKMSPTAYPPYYPPEIQGFSDWMHPDELMMSDLPCAVAWYGDRQCVMTTINASYEFFQFNDRIKPVHALYLTLKTMDARLFSECLQGGVDGWSGFVFERMAVEKIRPPPSDAWGQLNFKAYSFDIPDKFPLRVAPSGLVSGLFLTDRQRWQTE